MPSAGFAALFGREPEVIAEAHGRVNLIGEHTDYNDGFVLPTAIPQATTVALAARRDHVVRAASATLAHGKVCLFRLGDELRTRSWIDYVQGVTRALAERGCAPPWGFDLYVTSTVPVGSGLSSSAALELAVLRALRSRFALPLDDLELALVGQRAENDLVGAPVGIMDQLAASLGDVGVALFIDTRDRSWERVAIPRALELMVIDSGVPHDHATGDYRTRRGECERAAAALGVATLRDLVTGDLERAARLPPPLARRVHHVVSENGRVLEAVEALRAADVDRLGRLFHESHVSMRDDYQVSLPIIDALVAVAEADPDVAGARLTGGGFGGAIVALARQGRGAAAAARIVRRMSESHGVAPRALVPDPGEAGTPHPVGVSTAPERS